MNFSGYADPYTKSSPVDCVMGLENFSDAMEFEYDWALRSVYECRSEVLARLRTSDQGNDTESSESLSGMTFSPNRPVVNSCSKCPGFSYYSAEEFRYHSRSEWHLFNVRNPSANVSFTEWSENLDTSEPEDSVSSSSEDSDELEDASKPTPLILNSIPYHMVGVSGVAVPRTISDIDSFLHAKHIAVLILRSGRFAGAIWDSHGNVLVHSCLKRYTVRRKNGGSQRKNDNVKGSPANSIGAQIRRFQEQKLDEEVGEIISKKWVSYLDSASTIVFAYSSKSQTQSLFVGPLDKSRCKCKIFSVPMSVRDPTYAEVCRIHSSMTLVALAR